jgi:hypothetical protein
MKAFSILFLAVLFLAIACKNPCKDKDCGQGVCQEGTCLCNAGWSVDANGRCTVEDLCYNRDCGAHGTCNPQGECVCEAGWLLGAGGKCDVQDMCYNKDCGHGSCASPAGTCNCDTYYEKDANGICSIEQRSKYLGTWYGNDVISPSGTVSGFYTMTIVALPATDVSRFKIINFFNFSCSNPTRLEVYVRLGSGAPQSLCSQYAIGLSTFSLYLIDPDHLKIHAFVENAGTGLGYNLDGTYTRQ